MSVHVLACMRTCACACIHTWMRAYIRTCAHGCMHTYVHTCTLTFIHACLWACVACMHSWTCARVRTYMYACIHAYILCVLTDCVILLYKFDIYNFFKSKIHFLQYHWHCYLLDNWVNCLTLFSNVVRLPWVCLFNCCHLCLVCLIFNV